MGRAFMRCAVTSVPQRTLTTPLGAVLFAAVISTCISRTGLSLVTSYS
jgi:hypothetical protein